MPFGEGEMANGPGSASTAQLRARSVMSKPSRFFLRPPPPRRPAAPARVVPSPADWQPAARRTVARQAVRVVSAAGPVVRPWAAATHPAAVVAGPDPVAPAGRAGAPA